MRKANYITAILAAGALSITGVVWAAQGENTEAPADAAPIDVTAEQDVDASVTSSGEAADSGPVDITADEAAEASASTGDEMSDAADALEPAEAEASVEATATAQADDEKAEDTSTQ